MPTPDIDNNTPFFYQGLLDSAIYLENKGYSICLIDEATDLNDLDNAKHHHLNEPVYIAEVLGDGNCATSAMMLAFLRQGITQGKQSFVADKLCQIVERNEDQVKKEYKIACPSDFLEFIKQYRALTPEQYNAFFERFFLKNDPIPKFLSACARQDMCRFFTSDTFVASHAYNELVSKFDTKELFDKNLQELFYLGLHIDAEFLRCYLNNYHQISINVYQIYEDKIKDLDSLCSHNQEYNLLQAQQSENLHLNLIFFKRHFDTLIFKKDIDQYLEQNKDKWLQKQPDSLKEQLINQSSFINRQDTQITTSQDLIKEQDKLKDQSREYSFETLEKNESERLDNQLNEAYQSSNDSVINKKDKQIVIDQDLIQAKDKLTSQPSPGVFESESEYQLLEDSKKTKEIKIKQPKKNQNQLLKKQLDLLTECLFSHDTTVNEIGQQNAFLHLIKELKDALTDPLSRASLDHLDKKLLNDTRLILNQSIASENYLLKHSKNLKKILIEHQKNKLNFYSKQKDNKRLLKRLDLIEGCLSKLDDLNQGEKSALYSIKKCLKAKQVSQSWRDSLDNLDKELLDKAILILNRTGGSEEQLRKDSAELGKIYNEYKQKKLTRSPGLFSNKNNYSCRLQENQNGLNTDSVTCPLVY